MKKKKKLNLWFFLNSIATIVYLYWRVRYTLPLERGMISMTAGVILLVVELLGAVEAAVHYFNMNNIENPQLPCVSEEEFPHADVFIATYNEENDILYKTVNGCLHMDYPDKSKVHIYLCDDNRRPQVRELAHKMGVNYLDRPDNKGAKAGNLNHAMEHTSSPLIVTLDADMIPNHELLMKTVPYFVEAEKNQVKMGFVQSPQSFYNPDLYQFFLYSENRIPNEQDYFYKDIQVGRNKSNSVIYGGSNTVISRAALEEIGGFYTDAITEDFATGILLQKAKFKCIAISDVLASGLSPTSLPDLIQQRTRWARGVISTARKMHFILSPRLNLAQKVNYLASMWYWYFPLKIFVYLMAPIMFAVFGYVVIECNLPQVLLFWLPMYLCSNYTLRLLSGNIRTGKWSRVYETVLFPYMFFPVLLETVGISMKTFKVTNKGESDSQSGAGIRYSIPFAVFLVLSVLGIINCIRIMFETSSFASIVILFWLIANSFSLLMALFFVQGRKKVRKCERVAAAVSCQIQDGIRTLDCETIDFSEQGVAVKLTFPYYIDDEEEVVLRLYSDRYDARMRARVVHVSGKEENWKYSFFITQLEEPDKAQYFQLLYDREPTLPKNLDESLSSFDDLRLNITKRTKGNFYENRCLARINIFDRVGTTEGDKIEFVNYNYKYAVFKNCEKERFELEIKEGLLLKCRFERKISVSMKLYAVENCNELYKNIETRKAIEKWLTERTKQLRLQEAEEKTSEEETENQFDEMRYL